MASSLVLPSGVVPSNLHLAPGTTATLVEADLYDIARRVRELSHDLHIWQLEGGGKFVFAITENARDGVEHLLFRVKELDNRVFDRLARIMSIPLNERLKELERLEYKLELEETEKEKDDLYERVGAPMWHDLESCGFIQRGISYPKRGVQPRAA